MRRFGSTSRTSAKPRYEFRRVEAGIETFSGAICMPRHHHDEGYATVVLAGCLTEVSFAGRMHAEAGQVLLHGRFDCHLDKANERSLQILRLPWRHDTMEGQFYVTDPDALARLVEIDPHAASAQLQADLRGAVAPRDRYWVDDLASALRGGASVQLQEWAERRGLRPDTVSYVFRREFGVSPKRFRLECRTRSAWREIVRSACSLTDIAFRLGFSDLAHLSRSIHELTRRSPRDWRPRSG